MKGISLKLLTTSNRATKLANKMMLILTGRQPITMDQRSSQSIVEEHVSGIRMGRT